MSSVLVRWRVLAFWMLLVTGCFAAQPFRFAFLSDLHIGSSTAAEDLGASVQDINSQTNLAFAVISGDITEYGTREQLQSAHTLLKSLRIPYYIIPGNHDTKWSESGATDFSRIWQADRFMFEFGGYRFIGLHQGPLMRMGDGHWAPQDVRWLEQTLRSLPEPRQPIVFVTHYPVDSGIANWFVVLDLLKRYNVQMILCGHGHSNRKLNFESVPGVMGRSNLRAKQPVGGYNLVEVSGGVATFTESNPGGGIKPAPWHQVSLQEHDFVADTNRYSRPDDSASLRYPRISRVWTQDTGYTIASTPAVWKRQAIVTDASGAVRSFDLETGAPQWTFQSGSAVFSTPAVGQNRLVFASTDGNVYALRTSDGKRLWSFATDRPIVASAAISGNRVYIGSSEGKFRALDLRTGKLVWEWNGARNYIETRPLVYRDKVIFGAWDEHLYALQTRTGELAWKWKGDRPGALLSPAACWPVAANDRIFIVAPDRKMTALNAATGETLWRTGEYVVRESIGLSTDNRRIFVRAMNDFFYAFDTAAAGPVKLWEIHAGFGYDINSAMLVESGGVVFYGTKNGRIFALDQRTGQVLWEHQFGNGIVNTVLPLSHRRVLVSNFDGQVALLEAQEN